MKNNPKLNALQESFAVVLCGIMKSDGGISDKERKKFDEFFITEFGIDSEARDELFNSCLLVTDFDEHISLLKEGFVGNTAYMMKFMKYLNETILSDGIGDGEYALFEKVRDGLV